MLRGHVTVLTHSPCLPTFTIVIASHPFLTQLKHLRYQHRRESSYSGRLTAPESGIVAQQTISQAQLGNLTRLNVSGEGIRRPLQWDNQKQACHCFSAASHLRLEHTTTGF